jgi:hypothetical protein
MFQLLFEFLIDILDYFLTEWIDCIKLEISHELFCDLPSCRDLGLDQLLNSGGSACVDTDVE